MKAKSSTLIAAATIVTLSIMATALAFAYSGSFQQNFQRFDFNVVGIPASFVGVTVRSVPGAGAAWTIPTGQGQAQLDSSGQLEVDVKGLVLASGPAAGTTGNVTGVFASLTCERTNVVANTTVVPISNQYGVGQFQIRQTVTLPASCIGPIILIRVGSTRTNPGPFFGPWIAATGF